MKEKVIKLILSVLEGEFNHIGISRPDLYCIPTFYQKNGNFWVAIENDKIIGTVGIFCNSSRQGFIMRMCVDSSYRGTGVAQKLLSTLIDFAKQNHYKEIFLSTSANMIAAQKFYNKEGFEIVDTLPREFTAIGDSIFYKMTL